ncbi:6,7-dimethyl-8-ribityllumazine synthase [Candidatus Nanosalina sp. VS9-1]|uniref:6,7-dimethyl-8-ribityllumazine synthase n=1 Tax=Candidatus Nanosalina sp. VS9-1 TaxID=3388566 RepID=UPI0039DF6EEF
MKLGLVVAKFNRGVTEKMEEEAEQKADELDAEIAEKVLVPGAYDAPLAADRLARKEEIDAVAVLGAIIEGDTDHDKVIGDAIADKLSDISVERDTPVTLGVTGPGMNSKEASERTDYGAAAVEAAVNLVKDLPEA